MVIAIENDDGEIIACEGLRIEVFADESENVEIDIFTAEVEAEQFTKDYIDCEEKEYERTLP